MTFNYCLSIEITLLWDCVRCVFLRAKKHWSFSFWNQSTTNCQHQIEYLCSSIAILNKTLSIMGNKSSLLLRQEEIAQIQDETGCKYRKWFRSSIFAWCNDTNGFQKLSSDVQWKLYFISSFAVTPSQIERLYSRFTSLDRTDCGTLSRDDFLRIPELAINPLCDRIVHAFFADSTDDRVNFRKFMQVLAHFRPINKNSGSTLNSREEKLKCECF